VDPPKEAAWRVVLDAELDRAVLSVWGSSSHDVFVVGGPLGNNGFETLALHFDGSAWHDLKPGGKETFWWVNGSSPTDVWMVGTGGRIAHWDGASWKSYDAGTTATLWGTYAFSPSDAWIVGGTPEGGTKADNDIVLHWDGAKWSKEPLPDAPLGRSLYKVWGTSSSDLYVVGEAGTIWHRVGSTWTLESKAQPIATGTLFTVNGCSAKEVYAVGGNDVLRSDGATWSRLAPTLTSTVNGVSCLSAGLVAIVGFGGSKQRLVDGKFVDDFTSVPHTDLHATWADVESQAFWAVGGDFVSSPTAGKKRRGIVARYGSGEVPGGITP
jgi:hypothetical protein